MYRRFEVLDRKADILVETLDKLNNLFIVEAMQLSATIQGDQDFMADQDGIQKVRDDLIDHVVEFQDKLEDSEFVVPGPEVDDSIPASDPTLVRILEESQQQAKAMTAAIEKITSDQTAASAKSSEELAKALETLGKSSSNIKPTQPHFSPKNTLEDYLKYRDFKKNV